MKFEYLTTKISRQDPDNIAIKYRNRAISYRQLEEGSNKIANYLYRNVKEDKNVAIILKRSPEIIESIVGVLKAGLIFVPFDPIFPENRVRLLLKEINARWVITSKEYYEKFKGIFEDEGNLLRVLLVDGNAKEGRGDFEKVNEDIEFESIYNKNCYIYFTSGSTGIPKAVLGRHSSLVHFIEWEVNRFGVNESFNTSQLTNPSFDPYLRDIFVPLAAGATCCIPPHDTLVDPKGLIKWLDDNDITLMHIVPSLFKLLLLELEGADCFKHLKYILLAGELLRGKDISKFVKLFKNKVQLFNLYGPTETTLAKFYYNIKEEDAERPIIPVGKTIDGAQAMILDENKQKCLTGNVGEIYIRTPFISSGYYNSPRLTKKAFIKNPYSNNPQDIIYKTGDLGRALLDGVIELLGRVDNQVKIRGVRIETGEIENKILEYRGIKEALVTAVEDKDGEKSLYAYILPEKDVRIPGIRDYLFRHFPVYMVPAYFVLVDKIPLTTNGKVDKTALAEMAKSIKKGAKYQAPRNQTEKKLVKIWCKVLNLEKVGIDDDFVEMGGNSLNMLRLSTEINKDFDREIPFIEIYKNPTIKQFSEMMINSEFSGLEEEPFVLLGNPAAENKLFCFPPAQGFGLQYRPLVPYLNNYSLYAFNFLEDMDDRERLKKYVDIITGTQPDGPYRLMGWSAGGSMAFQAAEKLEKKGLNVTDIILIDSTWNPELKKAQNIRGVNEEGMENLKKALEAQGVGVLKEKIEKKMRKYVHYNNHILDLEVINATVHFIASSGRKKIEKTATWDRFTNKEFVIYQGVGTHGDMFEPEFVDRNGEIVRKIFDKIFSG